MPLLERDAAGRWRPRPQSVLERLFTIGYGTRVDLGWRMTKLVNVARALNAGDRSLAAIALVQAELPPLPDLAAGARMAKADDLAKAYDPNEPRVPPGTFEGGQWTTTESPSDPRAKIVSHPIHRASRNPGRAIRMPFHFGDETRIETTEASFSRDNRSIGLRDDHGQSILNSIGVPILRPAGMDPHAFVDAGILDRQPDADSAAIYSNVIAHLSLFQQGGPWDAQRANGQFLPQFRDYASVAIGLYGASAEIPVDLLLRIQNTYASNFSSFRGERMDDVYTSLPRRNVDNTRLGYDLYQSGRIGPSQP